MNEEIIYQYIQQTKLLQIDNLGRIWKVKDRMGGHYKPRDITPRRAESLARNGYLTIRIWLDGRYCSTGAHRLVYRVIYGLIPIGKEINHKNGIKNDNRPKNLEIVTRSENVCHALNILNVGGGFPGEKNAHAKLNNKQIQEIRYRVSMGESQQSIAQEFNVAQTTISAIITKRSWKYI